MNIKLKGNENIMFWKPKRYIHIFSNNISVKLHV